MTQNRIYAPLPINPRYLAMYMSLLCAVPHSKLDETASASVTEHIVGPGTYCCCLWDF